METVLRIVDLPKAPKKGEKIKVARAIVDEVILNYSDWEYVAPKRTDFPLSTNEEIQAWNILVNNATYAVFSYNPWE